MFILFLKSCTRVYYCVIIGPSNRERRTAAASRCGVRVLYHELSTLQIFFVVNLSTNQVLVTHGIDQQGDAIFTHGGVVFVGDLIEGEAVLEA